VYPGSVQNDIGDAIHRLLDELGWRTAELHRGIDLAPHPVVRFVRDAFAPRREDRRRRHGGARPEMMDFERDFLRRGWQRGDRGQREQRHEKGRSRHASSHSLRGIKPQWPNS
jgi:hypothetical protein